MTNLFANQPLLSATHAGFIQGHVSISVGARAARCMPAITRALGCRVAPDRSRVTVFVSKLHSAAVLEGLRANGAIAVVYTRPSTHQTIQLKGTDAVIDALAPGDGVIVEAWKNSFGEDLRSIGYSNDFLRALLSGLDQELVAVSFTPTAAFEQTPGPSAGQRLGSSE